MVASTSMQDAYSATHVVSQVTAPISLLPFILCLHKLSLVHHLFLKVMADCHHGNIKFQYREVHGQMGMPSVVPFAVYPVALVTKPAGLAQACWWQILICQSCCVAFRSLKKSGSNCQGFFALLLHTFDIIVLNTDLPARE